MSCCSGPSATDWEKRGVELQRANAKIAELKQKNAQLQEDLEAAKDEGAALTRFSNN